MFGRQLDHSEFHQYFNIYTIIVFILRQSERCVKIANRNYFYFYVLLLKLRGCFMLTGIGGNEYVCTSQHKYFLILILVSSFSLCQLLLTLSYMSINACNLLYPLISLTLDKNNDKLSQNIREPPIIFQHSEHNNDISFVILIFLLTLQVK